MVLYICWCSGIQLIFGTGSAAFGLVVSQPVALDVNFYKPVYVHYVFHPRCCLFGIRELEFICMLGILYIL